VAFPEFAHCATGTSTVTCTVPKPRSRRLTRWWARDSARCCAPTSPTQSDKKGEILPPVTIQEASGMVDMKQIYCIGRYGSSGEWSYVVESGCSEGRFISPGVSRDGIEVLVFDPSPTIPQPSLPTTRTE
jgi:hypothetical protein